MASCVRIMSWPDCDCASAANFAISCRWAIVSTLTLTPDALENASACLRSSSSEAGTKWFHDKKVSSRFCAYAGALPSASQVAAPAVAAPEGWKNWRRGVVFMAHAPAKPGWNAVANRGGLSSIAIPASQTGTGLASCGLGYFGVASWGEDC